MKQIEYGKTYVECDNCADTIGFEETNYNEINRLLKSGGWITKKIDNEWCDFCCNRCYLEFIK